MKSKFLKFGALVSATTLVAGVALITSESKASAFSQTYNTEGQITSITIPAGVNEIEYELQAGDGEDGLGECGGLGGYGAYLSGVLNVSPGDVLTLVVGADGDNSQYSGAGGFYGGGAGGDASYVYLNGEDNDDIVLTAGGGGGAGGSDGDGEGCGEGAGGDGGDALNGNLDGSDGEAGVDTGGEPVGAGTGGTSSNAGIGGVFNPVANGSNGNGLDGGNGGDEFIENYAGGGGGGAGFYGGGGGAGGFYGAGGGGAGASYVDEVLAVNEVSSATGEGAPFITISYTEPEESSTSSSSSTTTTLSEEQATPPNNGDGNNDGTVDEEQENVHTVLTNTEGPNGNTWVTFVHPEACEFGAGGVGQESDFDAQDPKYQYPANFFGFEIACSQPTVTVEMYFHGLNGKAADYIPRKYLPYNETYITLEGAAKEDVTMDGKNVVKVTYSIEDGGIYDIDQEVNGVIVDPASVAYSPASGSLPTTGSNVVPELFMVLVLLAGGSAAIYASRRKTKQKI